MSLNRVGAFSSSSKMGRNPRVRMPQRKPFATPPAERGKGTIRGLVVGQQPEDHQDDARPKARQEQARADQVDPLLRVQHHRGGGDPAEEREEEALDAHAR